MRFCWVLPLLVALGFQDAPPDGRAIMERAQKLNRAADETDTVAMDLVDEDGGAERQRRLVFYQKPDAEGLDRLLIRFLEPANIKGTGLLTLERRGADDDQWIYLPAQNKVKRIASAEKSGRFLGTDFTYRDLNPEDLDAYDYRYLDTKDLRGTPCYRVEARPRGDEGRERDGYAKRLVWIATDSYLPLRIEYHDRQEQFFKFRLAEDVRQLGRYHKAYRVEMRDIRRRHRTVLRFEEIKLDAGLEEEVFTRERLERE